MRFVYLLLGSFLAFSIHAQQLPSAAKELVAAENHFILLAKETNTRDAFIEHLADSGIVFDKNAPVLGKELWNKRKADASLLHWLPVYSDVAISGDFGYNTGPWEWSKDKTGAKPVSFGYFSSVWKKGKDGVWKVVIDMGMVTPGEEKTHPVLTAGKAPLIKPAMKGPASKVKQEFLQTDRAYIDQLNMQMTSFLVSSFAPEARLHHTNHFPVIGIKNIAQFNDSRTNYQFEQLGGDVASSGDMAYAYGKAIAQSKEDNKPSVLNYLRIWKKTDGKTWKIVLDVIGG